MSETEGNSGRDGQAEISGAEFFEATHLGYRGRIDELDEEGRSLLWRSGDLRARLMLNDFGMLLLGEPDLPLEVRRAICQLAHAGAYLADRLAYELHPPPKNMLKLEVTGRDGQVGRR